jgi:hypothetical protein
MDNDVRTEKRKEWKLERKEEGMKELTNEGRERKQEKKGEVS